MSRPSGIANAAARAAIGALCAMLTAAAGPGTAAVEGTPKMRSDAPAPGSNRLAGATSPYLLQHKDNPVDWYPWGEEAFAAARATDRPIFLSIGYSACHWCHVMEEESFEDPATAAVMNEHFVNIKVDREERPDLDDIYMTAVQMLTGRGGWPMSVWLTPDLKPFYGGTYFPKDRRYGMPSFTDVLTRMADAWKRDRQAILGQAGRVSEAVAGHLSGGRTPRPDAALDADLVAEAVKDLASRFDPVHGGFGPPPKFPPHRGLALLLKTAATGGDPNGLRMATRTLDAMAYGGIYDQIGGGFHRYSTDAQWLVPHFEKMLYDNALLSDVYVDAWLATREPLYRRIVEEIAVWLKREMTAPGGGFYATLDADSDGEEGTFYVWRPAEVAAALGAEEGALVNAFYGITEAGNFEGGASIPHVAIAPDEFARARGITPDALLRRLDKARASLLAVRERRVKPHRDDKVLSAWNGLMIAALARSGRALDAPSHLDAARKAAAFVLESMRGADGLARVSWREGRLLDESFLDDQAFMVRGLLALHEATGEGRWLESAASLFAAADAAFGTPDGTGWYFTRADRGDVLVRARNTLDNALPSGTSVMTAALLDLHRLKGRPADLERVSRVLSAHAGAMASLPAGYHSLLDVTHDYLATTGAPAGAIVTVEPPARPSLRPGDTAAIEVTLRIRDGWHINAQTPTLPELIPTQVTVEPVADLSVERIDYPPAVNRSLGFAGREIAVYEGSATIRLAVSASKGAAAGLRALPARLRFQACSDTACLRPQEIPLDLGVRVAKPE